MKTTVLQLSKSAAASYILWLFSSTLRGHCFYRERFGMATGMLGFMVLNQVSNGTLSFSAINPASTGAGQFLLDTAGLIWAGDTSLFLLYAIVTFPKSKRRDRRSTTPP